VRAGGSQYLVGAAIVLAVLGALLMLVTGQA
jgi:hypothetical protein